MGDAEDFSQEELEILGEVEETEELEAPGEPVAEDQEGEPDPEETNPALKEPEPEPEAEEAAQPEEGQLEAVPDEEPQSNIDKRIGKVVGEKKQLERRFELFKTLGAEKFYELHPEDAPSGYKPTVTAPQNTTPTAVKDTSYEAAKGLIVQDGPYAGKTLAEVREADQFAAMEMFMAHQQSVIKQNAEVEARHQSYLDEAERDLLNFRSTFAKDHFEKDLDGLSDTENEEVDQAVKAIIDFIQDPKNGTTNLNVAYHFLNKDNIISQALNKGAKGLADKLRQSPSASIRSGAGDTAGGSKYDTFMQMSPAQMASKMNNMSDRQVTEFINKAPNALKDKFPGVDWDPIG